MFHELCEEIFEDWKEDRLRVSPEVRHAFDLDCCPEPYLLFDRQEVPITFVTLNPGAGECFQRRERIERSQSPIRAGSTYREAASDLGRWYASPTCPTAAAAKTRVRAMQDLSNGLGLSGVEQIETLPFHSANAINSHRLEGDPLLERYKVALHGYIATRRFVAAMAGGLAEGSGARRMADVIGLTWAERRHLGLTQRNGRPTSGLVFSRDARGIHAVFYRQGGLGLPKTEHLPRIHDALR
jgi:hypothetical protein